jgi:hypothetical protein
MTQYYLSPVSRSRLFVLSQICVASSPVLFVPSVAIVKTNRSCIWLQKLNSNALGVGNAWLVGLHSAEITTNARQSKHQNQNRNNNDMKVLM